MILGIGIDIIEVKRIAKHINDPIFLTKLFTENEINYCQTRKNSALHFAARFAAKEAVIKAFRTGFIKGIKATDIEVEKNEDGAPVIIVSGKLLELIQPKRNMKIHVSLAHLENYATASAVIEVDP